MDVPTVPSTVPRGIKRKRPAPPQEDPSAKFGGKLHHALKDVRKAAKKARTFETQRVVKKLKSVRKKDPAAHDVAILEAEIEELKTSSPDTFADTALRTRLLKDLHISSDASACAAIARELPTSASTSASAPPSKVSARLLSSRVLAAAVSEAVVDLRALVLPPDAIAKAAHQADEGGENEDEDGDETEGEKVEQEGDNDSVSETMEDEDQAGWGLGSSDADDGGWESGSVHSAADPDSSHSASEEVDSESPLEAPPAAKRAKPSPPKSTKPTLAAKSSATTSQFLPTLAVGYIRAGSSDVEDIDAESNGRKNRRGQRARQAIWEKKYGRGANHKKKEAEEAAKANANGWNVKGKVAKGRDGQHGAKRRERGTESGAPRQGKPMPWQPAGKPLPVSSAPTGTPHMKTEVGAGLHPSWAAKRALKDRMGGAGAIVSSQGTKIVFE